MGLLGLHRIDHFFFFLGKSVGFCFQYIGLFFFLGELACYNFILFFSDFVQKFYNILYN